MLSKMLIKVNGLFLAGLKDESYNSSFKGTGWYDQKGNNMEHLEFVYDKSNAKVIEGQRNLKSWVNKIFQYYHDEQIDMDKIEIVNVDYLDNIKASLEYGLIASQEDLHTEPQTEYKA